MSENAKPKKRLVLLVAVLFAFAISIVPTHKADAAMIDTVVETFRTWACDTTPSHDKDSYAESYKNISYRVGYTQTGPHCVSSGRV